MEEPMRGSDKQPALPVILFQVTNLGLELLNGNWEDYPGLTPNRWVGISRGGWRSLVPEEYHSEVEKLTLLRLSEGYTVVEFPVYWEDTVIWLLVFAAAVALPEGGRKVVGLAQDVTREREWSFALAPAASTETDQNASESTSLGLSQSLDLASSSSPHESLEDLYHDLSGPLTTILVNCEMLMEDDCPPPVRQRLEGIFAEAMHINKQLRSHRRV
jgi:hypothetical protein